MKSLKKNIFAGYENFYCCRRVQTFVNEQTNLSYAYICIVYIIFKRSDKYI